ncbi:hypothetical protein I4U23_004398 [Adineta vaga]|nr:hypothetical protein I4U23_004398 [Adineta vaga]
MGCTCSKCDCSTCCCCCCEDDLVPQQQQLSSYHEHPMPTNTKILKSMPQGPAAIERMKKFGITTRNVSKLTDGYQNETVTSLEDALKFFNRKLVYLPESIKKAKEKCNRKKYNLTHDESAAIYLYSMARKPTSFFDELQRDSIQENVHNFYHGLNI